MYLLLHWKKMCIRDRYSILALTVVTTALGFSGLCLLLDPYSNFGRIAANLFRPAVMWGNNVLADWLMKMDNYSLFLSLIHI